MAKTDYSDHMSYDSLRIMRQNHPAWKLLASPQAPLAASFLYSAFILENSRELPEHVLADRLGDYLDQIYHEEESASAKETLSKWADDNHGWLRKFYPGGEDEIHYDLTSTAQKAIEWLVSLRQQSFIGTESRLITVFKLLQEIVQQSDTDPENRIIELERKKAELEVEIADAKAGKIKVLDSVQVKDRFVQAISTSRDILADFREVEQNFRELDRNIREKISSWDKGKGELLNSIFDQHDGIMESEQGKSFTAFLQFLTSKSIQEDFDEIVSSVIEMIPVREIYNNQQMLRIKDDWLLGSEHIQKTNSAISGQLRRYVDESYIEEERKIFATVKSIEANAIVLRDHTPKAYHSFCEIDGLHPEISLPFDRPLYSPSAKVKIVDADIEYGKGFGSDDSLYNQVYVDKNVLINRVNLVLNEKPHASLKDVISKFPIEQGLSELLTYLVIASDEKQAVKFDSYNNENISWMDVEGTWRTARLPQIIFAEIIDIEGADL